jgi:hypothetical protein
VVGDERPQLFDPGDGVLSEFDVRLRGTSHVVDVSQGVARGCRGPTNDAHGALLIEAVHTTDRTRRALTLTSPPT